METFIALVQSITNPPLHYLPCAQLIPQRFPIRYVILAKTWTVFTLLKMNIRRIPLLQKNPALNNVLTYDRQKM